MTVFATGNEKLWWLCSILTCVCIGLEERPWRKMNVVRIQAKGHLYFLLPIPILDLVGRLFLLLLLT